MYDITIEHRYVLPTEPDKRSIFTSVRNCPIVSIVVSKYDAVTFKGYLPNKYNTFIDQGPPYYLYLDLISKDYKLDDNDMIVKVTGNPIDDNTSEPVVLDWWSDTATENLLINNQQIKSITATHTIDINLPGKSDKPDIKQMINLCEDFIKSYQLSNTTNTGFTHIASDVRYNYPEQIEKIINLLTKYITKSNWKDSSFMQSKFLYSARARLGEVTIDPMEIRKELVTKLFKKL